MAPALESLEAEAPAINATIQRFGPFVDAANPAVQTLGDFAQEGRRLFPAIRPLVRDLRDLGRPLRPATRDLAAGFGSFDTTGGIEELMRFIFFYANSVNGVDRDGHYVRSVLGLSNCSARIGTQVGGCESTFDPANDPNAASAAKAEPLMDYLLGPEERGR
jgi:phospholipid/cholesterol/gamma-HCH transport system substrate-binding protein